MQNQNQNQPNINGLMFDPEKLLPYLRNRGGNNMMPFMQGSNQLMPTGGMEQGGANTGAMPPAGSSISHGAASSPDYTGIGAGIGALFGGSLFGGNNPYSAELKEMEGIPKYFDPVEKQYASLMADPGAVMSKFGEGFDQSPGYGFQKQQATEAANQAAAAGGMVGSPAEQQQLAKTVTGLSNQDYYNYINHVMSLYGQGLSGSKGVAEDLSELAESEAQMRGAQSGFGNQRAGGIAGGIGSGIGALAGHFL